MAFTIQGVRYYYTTVSDEPGEGYRVLSLLAEIGINLLAFTAIPFGPTRTQFTLFPQNPSKLESEAPLSGLTLDGPYPALLVQGDDELGALAGVHRTLFEAGVNVYASSGVSDGRGTYGYVLYVRAEDFETALETMQAT